MATFFCFYLEYKNIIFTFAISNKGNMNKFRKMGLEALEKELDKVDKIHSEIIEHLRYKEMECLVLEDVERQKYKKYPPVTITYVKNQWDEDFKDEGTGEVVTITRGQIVGVLHEGKLYTDFSMSFCKEDKKYKLSVYGNPSEIMAMYLNKKDSLRLK